MMQESYFAVIAKAQKPDGSYKPTAQLSVAERADQIASLKQRGAVNDGHYARLRQHEAGQWIDRTTRGIYSDHAVSGQGMERALKEPVRPSSVHRGVHYGSSVPPELEQRIDAGYKPGTGHRKGVVFHYGRVMHGNHAAAASPHVTTGHKGRVILSSETFHANGEPIAHLAQDWRNKGITFDRVLNHEAAHTNATGNPRRFFDEKGAIKHGRSLGEEARADGMSTPGRGLYQRIGNVSDKDRIAEIREHLKNPNLHQNMRSHYEKQVPLHEHYHSVHEKVQHAFGTTHDPEAYRDHGRRVFTAPAGKTRMPAHRPIHLPDLTKLPVKAGTGVAKPLIIGGAAAGLVGGGVAAHHLLDHYRRDHSGKFAPGANPSLRKH